MILGSAIAPYLDGVWACEFSEGTSPAPASWSGCPEEQASAERWRDLRRPLRHRRHQQDARDLRDQQGLELAPADQRQRRDGARRPPRPLREHDLRGGRPERRAGLLGGQPAGRQDARGLHARRPEGVRAGPTTSSGKAGSGGQPGRLHARLAGVPLAQRGRRRDRPADGHHPADQHRAPRGAATAFRPAVPAAINLADRLGHAPARHLARARSPNGQAPAQPTHESADDVLAASEAPPDASVAGPTAGAACRRRTASS